MRDAATVVVGGRRRDAGLRGGAAGGERAWRSASLPLGTRNHLARELRVPLDLDGAAALVAAGTTRRIDLARVGDRVFVNNASVGLYPAMVRLRDDGVERHRLPKWVAAVPASFAVLKRMRHHRMRLHLPDGERAVVTPMLFVGNNRYSLEAGHIGERRALDDGKLSVFAVGVAARMALIGLCAAHRWPGAPTRSVISRRSGTSPGSGSTAPRAASTSHSTAKSSACRCRSISPSTPARLTVVAPPLE